MNDPLDPNAERLQTIDNGLLTPLIRKVVGDQNVTVLNWIYESVSGGLGGGMLGTTFIYRFSGDASAEMRSSRGQSF
jgi:hypothetical protein